jgi:hypothetical protein
MDMLDFSFVICMSAALIFSVIQLCITFYEKGYKTGYNVAINSKKKKTTKKR